MRSAPLARLALVLAVPLVGACHPPREERQRRQEWVHAQAGAHNWYVREALNGTGDIDYYDGWYAPESDPKTGGGWRWMEKRSTTRLRTHVGDQGVTDMTVTVYGWVP